MCPWETLCMAGGRASKSFRGVLGTHTFRWLGYHGELNVFTSSPGRIHHCMRSIGAAQYALDLLLQRVTDPAKKTFGKYLYEHGTFIA